MKSILILFIFLIIGLNTFAQEDEPDVLAEPIGGIGAILKNVVYPSSAKDLGIEGKVLVKTIIDKNGNVIKTEILESVNEDCDKAAIDAINKVSFTPALMDGKPIEAEVVIPIMFKLM